MVSAVLSLRAFVLMVICCVLVPVIYLPAARLAICLAVSDFLAMEHGRIGQDGQSTGALTSETVEVPQWYPLGARHSVFGSITSAGRISASYLIT